MGQKAENSSTADHNALASRPVWILKYFMWPILFLYCELVAVVNIHILFG
jgi:hypothetical protein